MKKWSEGVLNYNKTVVLIALSSTQIVVPVLTSTMTGISEEAAVGLLAQIYTWYNILFVPPAHIFFGFLDTSYIHSAVTLILAICIILSS